MTAVATPAGAVSHNGGGLACHQLAESSHDCASAPSTYREGDTGGQMGKGASPSTSADPLVFRQGYRGETGDGKSRQTDSWGGWGHLGDAGEKSPGGVNPAPTWVSDPAVAPGVHRQKWGKR